MLLYVLLVFIPHLSSSKILCLHCRCVFRFVSIFRVREGGEGGGTRGVTVTVQYSQIIAACKKYCSVL